MHEMVWSTGYFIHEAVKWQKWRDKAAEAWHPGPIAYAEKQIHQWQMLAANADAYYVKLVPEYSKLI